MRAGGGKNKGSGYEREVCKKLSLWISDGKASDLFWRSSISGGRATVAFRKGESLKRQSGDITATAPEGHALTSRYFIECKHVKSLEIESFLLRNKGTLASFWRVVLKEAEKYGLEPLIIARQNHCKDIIIFKASSLRKVAPGFCGPYILSSQLGQEPVELRMFEDLLGVPFKVSE